MTTEQEFREMQRREHHRAVESAIHRLVFAGRSVEKSDIPSLYLLDGREVTANQIVYAADHQ